MMKVDSGAKGLKSSCNMTMEAQSGRNMLKELNKHDSAQSVFSKVVQTAF
jgi:hypothetical protein